MLLILYILYKMCYAENKKGDSMILVITLIKQIITMFLFMGIGFSLFKTKKISLEGNKELGMVLIYIILPSSIIKSFITDFSKEKLIGFAISFAAALGALVLSIIVSKISFGSRYKIEHFGTAFSNAGFIGIPLVKATIGDDSVFYIASFVALLNILQWTYGVFIMSGKRENISMKKIATNPIVIALLIGVLIFFSQVTVPEILVNTVGLLGNMTAPVAMITLGVYFAQIKIRELFKDFSTLISILLRLFIIPFITMLLLTLIPENYSDIRLTILIAACAPVGSNVAIFAQLNGMDYKRAVRIVCTTTVISILSIPLIVGIANVFWSL